MAYMENPTSLNIGGEKYRSVAEVKCPSCRHIWWHDEKNIPDGEMYECTCSKCGMLLKRKKV